MSVTHFINKNYPERTALITEQGQSISYAKLLIDIEKVSQQLIDGSIIFILGKNDYTTLIFYLASLESKTVPLLLSPELSDEQLQVFINKYQPKLILTNLPIEKSLDHFKQVSKHNLYSLFKNPNTLLPKLHNDLALLMTTSGSTGSPKLVRLSMNNLIANAASISEYLSITPEDRAIAHLPISYSYGLSIINSHLYAGASFYLTSSSLMEKTFWQEMKAFKITSFSGVPFHYETLLRLRFENMDLDNLKTMTQAGGKLAANKMEKVLAACQTKNIKFWAMYGQTEASPRISYLPTEDTSRKIGSIGKAIPHGHLWIKNEQGKDITSSGETGELVFEGENVCLGYAQSAEDLTLGDDNNGVLNTGDIACADKEGYFYIKGRIKRFLKIYGNRISLDQVESLLSKRGYESVAHGRDDKLTIQVVANIEFDTNAFRREIANLIKVNFVAITVKTITEIPRLENGKVDYKCLTSQL